MKVIIRKILCFFGFHHNEDCDECEPLSNISIMVKCIHCGKISEEQ